MTKVEKIFLFLFIFSFALGYALVSVLRHLRFESFGYDLGIYDQVIWLFSRFKSPFSTIKNCHIFGDHLSPILVLLSPIYRVIDDVRALLVFQAIWVAAGAIPVYLLAREKLGSIFLSFVLSFSYLAFFGIQNGVVFDFHPLMLAVPLIAWWFYFFEKESCQILILISLALLSVKENLSLLIVALGILALLNRKTKKEGLIMIVIGFAWFLLTIKSIIPYFARTQTFSYLPKRLPLSPRFFLKELFSPIEKTKTILISLGSVGFLPIFYPPIFIPLAEQFAERFVGNIVATRWGIGLHYSAPLAPVLLYGTVKALEKGFIRKKGAFLGGGFLILMTTLFYQFYLHLPLNLLLKKQFYQLPKQKFTIQKAIDIVGRESSLATQNNLLPHLSHREKIYLFSSCGQVPDPARGMDCQPLIDKNSKGLPLIEKKRVDFILVDFSPGQNPNNFFPDGQDKLERYVVKLLMGKKYQPRFKEDEILLLERL